MSHHAIAKSEELLARGRLGHDVCFLVCSGHPLEVDESIADELTDVVMLDVDVLASALIAFLERHADGGLVVDEQRSRSCLS